MKYRAPEGVTALFIAGEALTPDQAGVFEAAREWIDDLASHGCVALDDEELAGVAAIGAKPSRPRLRAEKAG